MAAETPTLPADFKDDFAAPDNAAVQAAREEVKILTATKFSDEEWANSIKQAQEQIKPSTEKVKGKKDAKSVAKLVDHTLLKVDAKPEVIDTLCAEARKEDFMSVCVRLPYVRRCVANLKGTSVLVACVVGFHEGTYTTEEKLSESSSAVQSGAAELDAVINWPKLQRGEYADIYSELASIRTLCPQPTVLKLIFETSQLNNSQILAACHLAAAAKFDFVKTSTGFNGHGATVEHVQLMYAAAQFYATAEGQKLLGNTGLESMAPMKVKASGGVRTFEDTVKMIGAGAQRIGASSGLQIVQQAKEQESGKTVGGANLSTETAAEGY